MLVSDFRRRALTEDPRTCNLDMLTPVEWLINYLSVHHGFPTDVSRLVQKFSIVTYKAAVVRVDLRSSHELYCDVNGGDSEHCCCAVFDAPFRLTQKQTSEEGSLEYVFTMQERSRP